MIALSEIIKKASEQKCISGKSISRQLVDALGCRFGRQRLGISEYYDLGIASKNDKEAKEFIGYRADNLYTRLNDSSWTMFSYHKIALSNYLNSFNCPQATIIGFYHPHCRLHGTATWLSNFVEIRDFLNSSSFPLVAKPSHGGFGRDIFCITEYNHSTHLLTLKGGSTLTMAQLEEILARHSEHGYIFQEVLYPSADTSEICGNNLSTVRVITLCSESKVEIFRCNWKIPISRNFIDNTAGWTNGNILAGVLESNGLVTNAFQGVERSIKPVSHHPETNMPIVGTTVPHWDEIEKLAYLISPIFRGLGFQAWDLALTSRGIIPLELNPMSWNSVFATQLVTQRGFLDAKLVQAIEKLEKEKSRRVS